MFKRRKRKDWLYRCKNFVYPNMGLKRFIKYVINRIKRLKASPYAISAGIACGVAMSFTPFLGLHFLLAGFLAFTIRASIVASAIGTAIGNPFTFPLIFPLIYKTGAFILGEVGRVISDESFITVALVGITDIFKFLVLFTQDYSLAIQFWTANRTHFLELWQVFAPMLVGALIWGGIVWGISFVFCYRFLRAYQNRRIEQSKQKKYKKNIKK